MALSALTVNSVAVKRAVSWSRSPVKTLPGCVPEQSRLMTFKYLINGILKRFGRFWSEWLSKQGKMPGFHSVRRQLRRAEGSAGVS